MQTGPRWIIRVDERDCIQALDEAFVRQQFVQHSSEAHSLVQPLTTDCIYNVFIFIKDG